LPVRGGVDGVSVDLYRGDTLLETQTIPADDTTEHPRELRNIRVFFKPQSEGEVPTCSLTWRDRNPSDFVNGSDQVHFNDNFRLPVDFTGFLELRGVQVGREVGAAVSCSLPPGMTIQGVATELTVALVNGGG